MMILNTVLGEELLFRGLLARDPSKADHNEGLSPHRALFFSQGSMWAEPGILDSFWLGRVGKCRNKLAQKSLFIERIFDRR